MKRVLSIGCLVAFAMARSAVAGGGDSFRMMTYNIRHGTPNDNDHIDLAATAAAIAAESPDFVCLQEVDRNKDRSGHVDQTAYLAEATGLGYGTFAAAFRTVVSGVDDGEYGVAILSKTVPISTNRVQLVFDGAKERRVLLVCEFEDFYIANSHLDTVEAPRLESLTAISNVFANLSKPIFFTGDWNDTPASATLEMIKGFMTVISPESGAPTCGSKIIDYITVDAAHANGFHVRSSHVKQVPGVSDHNPVVCDVVQRPAASELGWVDERWLTTGMTGTWSDGIDYGANSNAYLYGENTFTPIAPSRGNIVTNTITATFCETWNVSDPDATAQAAIRLGTNGCFQVWTGEKSGVESGGVGELGWVDVEAEGVTPVSGAEYTLRTTFDYTAGTYSVEVKTGLTEFTRLVEKENPVNPVNPVRTSFQLAAVTNCVSSIGFVGDTYFTSLDGDCRYEIIGFVADEALVLSNNVQVVLSAAKAAWLNSCAGGKTTVASAVAGLSDKEFSDAYLLNLDITDSGRSYAFEITSVDVGDTSVSVAVTLTRSGSIAQPINGVLKFYGAATLAAFKDGATELGAAELTNETFAGGETATATIPLSGEIPPAFFKAKIEE